MGLSVTVLGCDGSFAAAGGACSGYLVRGGGTNLWVDCGPGTLANLQEHIDLDELDGVVVTHAHQDHWVDLLTYLTAIKHVRKRTGVPVWSPQRVLDLAETVGGRIAPALDWNVVKGGSRVTVGGLTLTFSRTDHHPETLAVRFDEAGGASIGYSADTGPGWSLSELGKGLDLALCEATIPKDSERTVQHLSGRQAGHSAKAAELAAVITHVQPGVDWEQQRADASAVFSGPVDLATVGVTYEAGI